MTRYDPIRYATNKKYRDAIKRANKKNYRKNRTERIKKQREYNIMNEDSIRDYMREYMARLSGRKRGKKA